MIAEPILKVQKNIFTIGESSALVSYIRVGTILRSALSTCGVVAFYSAWIIMWRDLIIVGNSWH